MDTSVGDLPQQGKNPIEALSKEEITNKYKGLLSIAKKAKQAKDELTEENRKLKEALSRSETQKEADKNALMTMKEMLEQFTENKLQLTTELSELQRKSRADDGALEQVRIENESLKRQLDRLNEDNESLLKDIDRMEDQLKQVNLLGLEQKKHLGLLEIEVNKLKEAECVNATLNMEIGVMHAENKALKEKENCTQQALDELTKKYKSLKEVNAEQRTKFNALKDRFVEVHRKLKKLKECKRVLLETQHEYSDAVSQWQKEIIKASQLLCAQLNTLKSENDDLVKKLSEQQMQGSDKPAKACHVGEEGINVKCITLKVMELQRLSQNALEEHNDKSLQLNAMHEENKQLKQRLEDSLKACESVARKYDIVEESDKESKESDEVVKLHKEPINVDHITLKLLELHNLSQHALTQYNDMSLQLNAMEEENILLKLRLEETTNACGAANVEACNVVRNAEHLTQELGAVQNKIKEHEANYQALQIEKEALNNKLQQQIESETEIKQLTMELTAYKTATAEKCKDNEELRKVSKERAEKLQNSELEQSNLVVRLEKLEQERNDLSAEKQRLDIEVNSLTEKLIDNDKLREDLQDIRNVIRTMEEEKVELLKQTRQQVEQQHQTAKQANATEETLKMEIFSRRQNYEELLSRYELKEREHADLLDEMRELNEALKARGDVISRQQEKQQELVNDLKKTTTKLKQIEDKLNEKEQCINEKDEEMRGISLEIDATRNKVHELEEKCTRNEEQVRVLTEELQTLRNAESSNVTVAADCQSDILSTSTISRAEEISRMREVEESFEEKYNKLRGLAVKLKKRLQEQTSYVAEMEKQQSSHTTLKKDVEDSKKKIADLQREHAESQKLVESLQVENQKLKSSRKQANVLNLEIEAAEKSLDDATAKLAARVNELETLNEVLTTKENTIMQLRKEMTILESAKAAECTHSKELKYQIDHLQTQIKDAVHSKQNVLTASKELEQTQEGLKLELEEVCLQLANSASQHELALAAINAEKEQLEQRLLASDESLKTAEARLKSAERSLEDLRVEHIEYKVKAQAVLRKNQSKDTTKERELEEELLELRSIEQQLQANALKHIKKIEESDKQIELLQEDNENLQRRGRELMNLVEELRSQNETMAQDNRQQMQMQQESLQTCRQQMEKLDAYHKQQLEDLENNYQRQIEQLKVEQAKVMRMPPIIGAASARAPQSTINTVPHSEQSKIDYLLMEREDAEGSEEAAEALANLAAGRKISNASRRSHEFMPLDELLNAPMNAISDTVTTVTSGTSLGGRRDNADALGAGSIENMHFELQATKERLQIQESRVRHLTSLLAENEQDLARLTQMNDMLKEELRRQERTVEREKHMHNSEYLKNVVLKFLTLSSGDERTRLVPVLNTILRLSRSETEMLNCVAKGQKVTTDSNQRGGWGSFLPSWNSNNN